MDYPPAAPCSQRPAVIPQNSNQNQHNNNNNDETRRPGRPCRPCGRVPSAAEPSAPPRPARPPPLRCVAGRHQPVDVHARAHTGEAREELPRSKVERHRPAAAALCRGPAVSPPREKGARCYSHLSSFFSNHPARRRPYPPLLSSSGCGAIGQRRQRPAAVCQRHRPGHRVGEPVRMGYHI